MKTTERFDRAIKALVVAFFDETLAKGECSACAVGNIVASAYNQKVPQKPHGQTWFEDVICDGIENSYWRYLFCTSSDEVQERRAGKNNSDIFLAIQLISKTGYSEEELAMVEFAFEKSTKILIAVYPVYSRAEIMQDQFNGLMATVDVLCAIEGYDSAEYKKLFEYTRDLQPINAM